MIENHKHVATASLLIAQPSCSYCELLTRRNRLAVRQITADLCPGALTKGCLFGMFPADRRYADSVGILVKSIVLNLLGMQVRWLFRARTF